MPCTFAASDADGGGVAKLGGPVSFKSDSLEVPEHEDDRQAGQDLGANAQRVLVQPVPDAQRRIHANLQDLIISLHWRMTGHTAVGGAGSSPFAGAGAAQSCGPCVIRNRAREQTMARFDQLCVRDYVIARHHAETTERSMGESGDVKRVKKISGGAP